MAKKKSATALADVVGDMVKALLNAGPDTASGENGIAVTDAAQDLLNVGFDRLTDKALLALLETIANTDSDDDAGEEVATICADQLGDSWLSFLFAYEPTARLNGMGWICALRKFGPRAFPAVQQMIEWVEANYCESVVIEAAETLQAMDLALAAKTLVSWAADKEFCTRIPNLWRHLFEGEFAKLIGLGQPIHQLMLDQLQTGNAHWQVCAFLVKNPELLSSEQIEELVAAFEHGSTKAKFRKTEKQWILDALAILAAIDKAKLRPFKARISAACRGCEHQAASSLSEDFANQTPEYAQVTTQGHRVIGSMYTLACALLD